MFCVSTPSHALDKDDIVLAKNEKNVSAGIFRRTKCCVIHDICQPRFYLLRLPNDGNFLHVIGCKQRNLVPFPVTGGFSVSQ
jgi:hypothetical protein